MEGKERKQLSINKRENVGKRRRENNRKNKSRNKIISVIRSIILLTFVFVLTYVGYGMYKEGRIPTLYSDGDLTSLFKIDRMNFESDLENENINDKNVKTLIEPVEEIYKGYEVDSRLEIPKIKLNTNVLKEYSEDGLEVCASKYYGPSANEEGNYCIAGHNYNKENMFNHLIDLSIEDSIFLTDNKNGMVEYVVYDIYKVKPQNIEPLSQETHGKKVLTLITCVNYSKNRLVIKAVEK